ncbi:hypothetical protein [Janthinobacterium fluminis]|uniref:Uncharacterized protein n=1 Tax=Janthinobacterium fluminis TaxID=2987524 RepID=A0ABT5K294_9BURK|nr:hypothetical protein [Janthinobacterium fluminis]MDC8758790.1 hypothetical protein [Janthinobacterium fluminis]
MTASYQHLALAQVQEGMVLSDELLDMQGHVLLPQGTVLSAAMLALMPRHGIEMLPIAGCGLSEADAAAARAHFQQRLARLFRQHAPDNEGDWATGLLRRFVEDYRLGKEAPQ